MPIITILGPTKKGKQGNHFCNTILSRGELTLVRFAIFTSREAARSREGVVLPGEEEDVCLKKGVFCFLVHGSFIIWSFMVTVMLFGLFFSKNC